MNLYRSAPNTLKTDDSFIIGGTLNVSGLSTLGSLTVSGATTFNGTLTVNGDATFNGNLTLASGKLTGNTNTRGQATITAGNTTVTYTFEYIVAQ